STSTASQKRYGFRPGPETECFSPRASYLGTFLRPLSSSRTRALSLEAELAQSAKHDQRPLVQERHHLLPVGRHLHGRQPRWHWRFPWAGKTLGLSPRSRHHRNLANAVPNLSSSRRRLRRLGPLQC